VEMGEGRGAELLERECASVHHRHMT